MVNKVYALWFRQDLRLLDNTALYHACQQASESDIPLIAIFYLTPLQWQRHDKSVWQIDLILRSLLDLSVQLRQLNIALAIREVADFDEEVDDLLSFCQKFQIQKVFANAEYEVNEQVRDEKFAKSAIACGIDVQLFDDQCVIAPKQIVTAQNTPYQVFTPFYKRWLAHLDIAPIESLPAPQRFSSKNYLPYQSCAEFLSHDMSSLMALYQKYQPGFSVSSIRQVADEQYPATETAALTRLQDFIDNDIARYDAQRDVPELMATSQVSMYLAIGRLSARTCYLAALQALKSHQSQIASLSKDGIQPSSVGTSIMRWVSELAWRDFYKDVMVNRPDIVKGRAFLHELDKSMTWRYDPDDFLAWCQGRTGVPLVDAAMRCLNATGFMHNRLRMVVAMFLTKDLLIDWRWGERYFMQHLVDGDFAANNGGWQWSASVGTDAAPYFRIMNPFSQAKTHDKNANFIKQWLPELIQIPATILHDENKLRKFLQAHPHINYPLPMVNHKQARLVAIEQFKNA